MDERHILHTPFQYILERLAAQKLEPKDLRIFLRLGDPLGCLSDRDGGGGGGFLPLTRIKTLVSMTTPRDMHLQNNSISPPFIEFDMAPEGFGCLYLPSLCPSSPLAASSSSVVSGVGSMASQDSAVIGGIGQGDRAFPPASGLTFATWICIDKFSDPRSDPHPVRLLTLARTVKGAGGNAGGSGAGVGSGSGAENDRSFVCLSVCLSSRDKALVVSTQESEDSRIEERRLNLTVVLQ